MKFLILVNNYPSALKKYAEHFVHTRVLEYLKQYSCLVVSDQVPADYEFEGVSVVRLNDPNHFKHILNEFQPDRILVHFALKRHIRLLRDLNYKIIVWVHGYEALGWYRRWFDIQWFEIFTLTFIRKLISNISQQYTLRKFIQQSNQTKNIQFIFVSNWMLKVTEADTLSHIKYRNIIPNPIDEHGFDYQEKQDDQRFKILIIRPFISNKYALDLAIDTILTLSQDPVFDQLEFSIYGQGPLWQPLTEPLKAFRNISLHQTFLNKEEMRSAFKQHGIFLCPSRQDAQGVTMCEAMSCGLVPITSNNTALPEFVQNEYNGYALNSVHEMATAIKQLASNPFLFQDLSKQTAHSIRQKAGLKETIKKEIAVILA